MDLQAGLKEATAKERLLHGKETKVPIGHCWLTLEPAVDPVFTPSGHVYTREAILTYLLNKTQEIKALKKAYDEQQEAMKMQEAKEKAREKEHALKKFERANQGFMDAEKRKRTVEEEVEQLEKKRRVDTRSKEEKVEELKSTSFWLSRFTPSADAKLLDPPPKRPPSPNSGKPLKISHLKPLTFARDETGSQIICPVSQKPIKFQPVVLIKPSKVVLLKSVFEELNETKVCPVSGVAIDQKMDVIELKTKN